MLWKSYLCKQNVSRKFVFFLLSPKSQTLTMSQSPCLSFLQVIIFIPLEVLCSSPKEKNKDLDKLYKKINIDGEEEIQFLVSALFLFYDIFIVMIIIKLTQLKDFEPKQKWQHPLIGSVGSLPVPGSLSTDQGSGDAATYQLYSSNKLLNLITPVASLVK